jgi:hypothetical protein
VLVAARPRPAFRGPAHPGRDDPYANAASQHRTDGKADTFSFGSTIVSAFQVGRIFGGGVANSGFAVGQRRGHLDRRLPAGDHRGGHPPGPSSASSDPAVAFDARHSVWLLSSLGIRANGTNQVVTSRSPNGGQTWSTPVATSSTTSTGSPATTPQPAPAIADWASGNRTPGPCCQSAVNGTQVHARGVPNAVTVKAGGMAGGPPDQAPTPLGQVGGVRDGPTDARPRCPSATVKAIPLSR